MLSHFCFLKQRITFFSVPFHYDNNDYYLFMLKKIIYKYSDTKIIYFFSLK